MISIEIYGSGEDKDYKIRQRIFEIINKSNLSQLTKDEIFVTHIPSNCLRRNIMSMPQLFLRVYSDSATKLHQIAAELSERGGYRVERLLLRYFYSALQNCKVI